MIQEYENPHSLGYATLERAGNVFLKSSLYENESNEVLSALSISSHRDQNVRRSSHTRDRTTQGSSKLKQEILSFVFHFHDSGTSIVSCMAKFLVKHCSLEEVVSVVTKDYWPQKSNIDIMSQACIFDRHDVFDYLVLIGTVPEQSLLDISTGSVRDTLLRTMCSKNLLMNCCINGDVQTAIKLIMNGTKPNSKKQDYLMAAISNNKPEMVELLISMNARVNEDHLIEARSHPQIAVILDK